MHGNCGDRSGPAALGAGLRRLRRLGRGHGPLSRRELVVGAHRPVRSRLWDPDAHMPADEAPDLDAVLAAQVADLTLEESRAIGAASVDDPLW